MLTLWYWHTFIWAGLCQDHTWSCSARPWYNWAASLHCLCKAQSELQLLCSRCLPCGTIHHYCGDSHGTTLTCQAEQAAHMQQTYFKNPNTSIFVPKAKWHKCHPSTSSLDKLKAWNSRKKTGISNCFYTSLHRSLLRLAAFQRQKLLG